MVFDSPAAYRADQIFLKSLIKFFMSIATKNSPQKRGLSA